MKIGICDYGIGGIGLYQYIRKQSDVDIIYFSDSGYTPYGKVSAPELKERIQKVIAFFHAHGVEYIAVACNAASTVIPENKNITGIIEHGIQQVLQIRPEKIAIAGGSRTIDSQLYKKAFEAKGIQTWQQVAQQLSGRIEAGDVDSAALENDIEMIFSNIRSAPYILLACTHYPAISKKIQDAVPQSVLLDPAEEMYKWIFKNWSPLKGNNSSLWYTTGNTEKMKLAAKNAFGVETQNIQQVIL